MHEKEKSFRKCNNCKRKHKTKNLFCTKECREIFKFKETLNRVKRGELKDTNRVTIKKVVTKLNGHQCSICNNGEWQEKKIPLILDHIDGDYENNKLNNLRLVCPNCDAQLPTYKGKNRGKGRKDRTLAHYEQRFKNSN